MAKAAHPAHGGRTRTALRWAARIAGGLVAFLVFLHLAQGVVGTPQIAGAGRRPRDGHPPRDCELQHVDEAAMP
ncbi:hypothetical protein AB4028_15560 [Janibacter sp. RAF20_2_2]|uniref:hypothetical protein n=1 Tax=unclassified Janibacter TaxID=2649294 RepID=UPI003F8F1A26